MEEKNENHSKKMIIDGQIVDLDKISLEELKKIKKRLDEKEKQIKQAIEKELER